jgi:hypothetical protein
MAKAPTIDRFRRGETVKTLDALPGVPPGTRGRVELVAGFAWTRYRVLFENGVDVGSLDGSTLARPKQFDEALARRDEAAESEAGDGGGAGGGEDKTVNGVSIPAHLLDRSKRARERLTTAG